MEAFRGSLAHYRMALLMPALVEGKAVSGTLTLERGGIRREFLLKDGAVVAECSNDPREHLAQVLADLRILDAQKSATAYEAAEAAGMALGTFLVERGFIERPRLLEALEHKAREAFFDCYAWESGELELKPWDVQTVRGEALRLKLGPLHRDAMARLREWRAFREVFNELDSGFRVFREHATQWGPEEEQRLLELAETGASLGDLLHASREGQLFTARRLMHLYRRGALSPKPSRAAKASSSPGVDRLLEQARQCLSERNFHGATRFAERALEREAIPEAQALYREAEMHLALAISDEILNLEGRLIFEPLPGSLPGTLTADDLYLYSKLKSARSIRVALRTAAMGELAAYRSVERLLQAGLIHKGATPPNARRQTQPFGPRA